MIRPRTGYMGADGERNSDGWCRCFEWTHSGYLPGMRLPGDGPASVRGVCTADGHRAGYRRTGRPCRRGLRTASPVFLADLVDGTAQAGYESTVSNHHVNLTPQEESLIAESHPEALARLDDQAVKELQSRLRNAREKNFSLLRREGAARVEAEGGRGAAAPANEKRSEKVDVFEEALARVGERLASADG